MILHRALLAEENMFTNRGGFGVILPFFRVSRFSDLKRKSGRDMDYLPDGLYRFTRTMVLLLM